MKILESDIGQSVAVAPTFGNLHSPSEEHWEADCDTIKTIRAVFRVVRSDVGLLHFSYSFLVSFTVLL